MALLGRPLPLRPPAPQTRAPVTPGTGKDRSRAAAGTGTPGQCHPQSAGPPPPSGPPGSLMESLGSRPSGPSWGRRGGHTCHGSFCPRRGPDCPLCPLPTAGAQHSLRRTWGQPRAPGEQRCQNPCGTGGDGGQRGVSARPAVASERLRPVSPSASHCALGSGHPCGQAWTPDSKDGGGTVAEGARSGRDLTVTPR